MRELLEARATARQREHVRGADRVGGARVVQGDREARVRGAVDHLRDRGAQLRVDPAARARDVAGHDGDARVRERRRRPPRQRDDAELRPGGEQPPQQAAPHQTGRTGQKQHQAATTGWNV
jgi:hypothetical protein